MSSLVWHELNFFPSLDFTNVHHNFDIRQLSILLQAFRRSLQLFGSVSPTELHVFLCISLSIIWSSENTNYESPYLFLTRARFFLRCKAAGAWTCPLSPCNAEITNARSYTSTPVTSTVRVSSARESEALRCGCITVAHQQAIITLLCGDFVTVFVGLLCCWCWANCNCARLCNCTTLLLVSDRTHNRLYHSGSAGKSSVVCAGWLPGWLCAQSLLSCSNIAALQLNPLIP